VYQHLEEKTASIFRSVYLIYLLYATTRNFGASRTILLLAPMVTVTFQKQWLSDIFTRPVVLPFVVKCMKKNHNRKAVHVRPFSVRICHMAEKRTACTIFAGKPRGKKACWEVYE
jgi:hypothetical protein